MREYVAVTALDLLKGNVPSPDELPDLPDKRANPVIDVPFRRIHAGMTTTLASRVSRAVGMSWQDWAEHKPSVVISKILRSKSLSREASQRLANEIRAWVARNSRKVR